MEKRAGGLLSCGGWFRGFLTKHRAQRKAVAAFSIVSEEGTASCALHCSGFGVGFAGLRIGFVLRGGSGWVLFGLVRGIGFVWRIAVVGLRQRGAACDEAVEFVEGSAVVALGLGLVAEEEAPGGGVLHVDAMEAVGEEVALGLEFVGIVVEFAIERDGGGFLIALDEDFVERSGAEAGFDAGDAEEAVLGEGDAFEGEEFLGVDGLVGGDEAGAEAVDGGAVFDGDDGEGVGGEGVFAGEPMCNCVLRCSGLAGGGAGAGGAGGVSPVGGELFVGGHLLEG